ncbi:MAG: glutathione S-transferase N-terminal domain-containing protein [Hyphomonadaceae bacterium]|nr:MAG: glutathione S-transferase [Caulobacteraceae bacterium]MBT9445956.1 glutathione S-transferase N-terminal domain-containing protein [Hyphomonadaceae bacterium]TPW08064.1 MAG: glutathione S-transferase [Alphaproteobacteria bacterium]
MIDFYAAKTPNARKISIMLEECDARYQAHMIDIGKGEQFSPEFLRVNPNAKIPAIVDQGEPTPVSVFESAAILIYLGEKFGRLLPTTGAARASCISWTVWQVANVGPMFGQANHFTNVTTEECPYAVERFSKEAARLIHVMETRLGVEPYLAGTYSIADIAVFPWIRVALDPMARARPELIGETPNIRRWFGEVGARPAVQRGIAFAT